LTQTIDRIAATLISEHRDGTRFHRLEGLDGLADAYRAQDAHVAGIIGDDRIAGSVFARRVLKSGAHLRLADYHHLGLEFETCVRLGRDLAPDGAPFTPESAGAAVDAVAAAIELVEDRNADYRALDCATLVADNSWNAGIVLGTFVPPPARLDEVVGVVRQDGAELTRGRGADALGHPFVPLAWLANHLAERGRGLRAGQVVMTGSIATTRFPAGTFGYRFEISGIGAVEVGGG